MQSFKFRLHRVLEWQSKVCRIEEEGVRLCRLAITGGEERISELQARSLATEQELLGHRALAARDLIAFASFHVDVVQRFHELSVQQLALGRALDAQMCKMITARRQLQLLETLRDRSLLEYNLNVNRELEGLALEAYLSRRAGSARQDTSKL
jgi:hypothetical protein